MIDISKEREFIEKIDKRTRELELEKAKLEQNKVLIKDQLRQVVEKMESLGCNPDNINEKISESEQTIGKLKLKMESLLPKEEDTL